jgi:hypothetical protein
MKDLNALVDTAVEVLMGIMEKGERHEQLAAAEAALTFVATLPVSPARSDAGCQHPNKTNLTTMGGGPLREACPDCGARWVDGAMVDQGSKA